MPPYCRGSKHQKNGLAPLEERKRLCDPPNLPNLISFICLFPINMQPLALFLRKEPGGLSSISRSPIYAGERLHFSIRLQSRSRISGKRRTSRMEGLSVRSITSRSIPIHTPPVGGLPY